MGLSVAQEGVSFNGGTNTLRSGSIDDIYKLVSPGIYEKTGKSAPNDHVIIISGGGDSYCNHVQYWNDCSLTYQYFTDIEGIPASNITVLMADGLDPGVETLIRRDSIKNMPDAAVMPSDVFIEELGAIRYYKINAPTDLDGDGIPDIDYSATRNNVLNVFDSLSTIGGIENLWIFVTDHGNVNQICLWDPFSTRNIYPADVRDFLDRISFKHANIFFAQCYSGGFLSSLKGANRTIVTATSASRYSWSTNGEFSCFFEKFFDALTGTTYLGLKPENGDYIDVNKDNKVSFEEAFVYAKDNDKHSTLLRRENDNESFEAPQFYSSESDFIFCRYDLKGRVVAQNSEQKDTVIEAMYDLVGESPVQNCDVVFRSGKYIHLRDGFSTKNANFRTEFISCEDSLYHVGDINSMEYLMTELNEHLNDESWNVELYPVPTKDVLNIRFDEEGDNLITIADMRGIVVFEGRSSSREVQIDLSDRPTGIYIVHITNDNGVYTKYIIVK